ncbi:peptidase S8/S53 domain-containing protein [Mycena olivaceomarginata]|nr:peptidase S8/S53 domain-containing protein [Mycena olivaceomarginata]
MAPTLLWCKRFPLHSWLPLPLHWLSRLESLLQKISDPSHPEYGNHLSKEQVHALSKTFQRCSWTLLNGWLATHNASSVKWSASKDNRYRGTTSLFCRGNAIHTLRRFSKHLKSGNRVVRTLSYSLPQDWFPTWHGYIPQLQFFDPSADMAWANSFLGMKSLLSSHLEKRPVALNQSDFTSCCTTLENYTPAIVDGSNRIGVAGYLNIWARPESLKLYLNDYIPESIGSNYTMDIVNITAMRGILILSSVAYPIPMTYYSTSSVPPYIPDQNQDGELPGVNEPYLDFIDYLLGLDEPPTVITTSYGDDEQTDYANACIPHKLTSDRGVSVLFSTGDQGLGVDDLPTCIANTGNNATTFLPVLSGIVVLIIHGSVTSVGETEGLFPQTATFASGAGFSYYFDRPSYQDAAVSVYLNGSANSDETVLQSSGGGVFRLLLQPVGFIGRYQCRCSNCCRHSRLAQRLAASPREPTMGFLNPFLYSAGLAGLVDITDGFVNGCEQPGFNATKGWDPASGLGFFDFEKLQSLVL